MIIVTGGAGFIGSNIVKALNHRGINDILVVDNLKEGKKVTNLADLDIADYMSREDFILAITEDHDFCTQSGYGKESRVQAIFHEGACSSTTEWDGIFIMNNNYEYSKSLLHWCDRHNAQFLYASSASVYGAGHVFKEAHENEQPLNIYAYSKFQFDQYVRRFISQTSLVKNQVVGFRYFNVYGPREQHKGAMSSTAFQFHQQITETGVAKLFVGSDGYHNGEQRRDFVYIDDVVNVNLWFLDNPDKSGVFNVGTGRSQSFNDMANAVLKWHSKAGNTSELVYIPFPDYLKGVYQSFTEADTSALRDVGYTKPFRDVEQGVKDYLDCICID